MATQTVARGGSREGPAERLAEFVVLGGMAALTLAAVLPLALVAVPVLGALYALRWRPRAVRVGAPILCLLPALVAILAAVVTRGVLPVDVTMGYVDVQLEAAVGLARAWQSGGAAAFDWRAYGQAVWPYAVCGGLALGGLAGLAVHSVGCFSKTEGKTALKFDDLGTLAATDDKPVAWALPRVVGRGVLTLVSAPPGGGKGWWLQGLVRAMQDAVGGQSVDFYGLPVTAMKLLWCTEEGESVTTTARRFGIRPGQVEILRRDRVQGWDWPALVREVRREAWRRKCQVVVFDTVRAWCPQAERTPELANEVMHVVRRELTEPGLAAVFVHHDRKGGGEHGEGVAGTFGLVGAVDVLVELKRVPGRDDARQMVVSRRYGDLDVTATLRGHRYVADRGQPPPPPAPDGDPAAPTVASHLQRTLDALGAAAGPRTVEELLTTEGGSAAALGARLKALEALGLVAHTGRGVKNDPVRWRTTGTPVVVPGAPNAVRDDPAYVAYLKSPEWAEKRQAALATANGRCGRCPAPAAEVHHLTYERVGAELPGDLIALCPPCHRLAHPVA